MAGLERRLPIGSSHDHVHLRSLSELPAKGDQGDSGSVGAQGIQGPTGPAGPAGGGVTTFEGRAGVVVSAAGDYSASEITNNSDVVGVQLDDALNYLLQLTAFGL